MRDKRTVLIGSSIGVQEVVKEIDCAARSNAKVLITGESGVGKEIVARMIHERSARAHAPLVTINCAGVPDSLLESELFGHVKGSFTDAWRDKRGLLEAAHGGTVFLDEIGEMSLRMQALLLRFLETGEIQRVGSDRHCQTVDVRVVTATHRNLLGHMAEKTFREDLYYRLNVVHIEVPPLRERRDDIVLLLEYFFALFADTHLRPVPQLSPEALQTLVSYDWRGNIRQLRNVSERLVLQHRTGPIEVESLPAEIWRGTNRVDAPAGPVIRQTHEVLFERLLGGASFWSEVCEPFMARDLTRHDVREVVRLGLEHTRGNYKLMVQAFNMDPGDYRRFLSFLRKFQCHVPFQAFRMLKAPAPSRAPEGLTGVGKLGRRADEHRDSNAGRATA